MRGRRRRRRSSRWSIRHSETVGWWRGMLGGYRLYSCRPVSFCRYERILSDTYINPKAAIIPANAPNTTSHASRPPSGYVTSSSLLTFDAVGTSGRGNSSAGLDAGEVTGARPLPAVASGSCHFSLERSSLGFTLSMCERDVVKGWCGPGVLPLGSKVIHQCSLISDVLILQPLADYSALKSSF